MKKIVLICLAFILFASLNGVYHKVGDHPSIGFFPNNYICSIHISGNYAYCTAGSFGFFILDITEPHAPVLMGICDTPGIAKHAEVSGNYAYVADGHAGVQTIDISDPADPNIIGGFDTPGDAWCVSVFGSHAFIADGSAGVHRAVISNPYGAHIVDSYDPGSVGSVAAYDDETVFAITGATLCSISFDQGNTSVHTYNTSGNLNDIELCGDTAYVVGYHFLDIFNVSNSSNVTLIGSHQDDSFLYPVKITVSNNIAYVSQGIEMSHGLTAIDVSNPQHTSTIGQYFCYTGDISVSGNYAYLAAGPGLQVIDISDPSPNNGTHQAVPMIASNYKQFANWGYFKASGTTIGILDANDPFNPEFINSFTLPYLQQQGIADFTHSNDQLYVLANYLAQSDPYEEYAGKVYAYDVSDPNDIQLVKVSNDVPGGAVCSIAVADSLIYLAAGDCFMTLAEGLYENNYQVISELWLSGVLTDIELRGEKAYVTGRNSGLNVLDIADPQNPVLLASCASQGWSRQFDIYEDCAYLSNGDQGVRVISIADPDSLVEIAWVRPHSSCNITFCQVDNGRLVVSDDNWNQITMFDVSNPQSPVWAGVFAWNMQTNSLHFQDGVLYTANYDMGIHVITHDFVPANDPIMYPQPGLSLAVYPNPFNLETTISYCLPKSSQVDISIFNSRGQFVTRLSRGRHEAGKHALIWDGKDNTGTRVASGLYFCRIIGANTQVTKKLVLLK